LDILSRENLFDLLVFILLLAGFIVGYLQGAVRRLIGIVAVTFSLIVAAHLRSPLGDFLAGNWGQFPPGYSDMLAFGFLFVGMVIVFAIITQVYYERGPLLPRWRYADALLGGLLGVIQALLFIGALILILDSYFATPDLIVNAAEFTWLRDLDNAVGVSRTADLFRGTIWPAVFALIGFFIPEELRRLYPR